MKLEVIGLEKLLRKLRPSHLIDPPLKDLGESSTKKLARDIKSFAPKLTGAMAGDIEVFVKKTPTAIHGEVLVGKGLRYPRFVESGTRKMRGRRFVRRAISNLHLETLVSKLGNEIERRWNR